MRMVKQYIEKFGIWGVRGTLSFCIARFASWRLYRFFKRNLARYAYEQPEEGFTLIADFQASVSLSKTMRDLAFSLRDAGIPFQTFDLGNGANPSHLALFNLLTPRESFRLARYSHVVDMAGVPIPNSLNRKYYRVVFWEFESGLLEYNNQLTHCPGIIGMSDFNVTYFRKILPKETDVRKLLYPLRFEIEGLLERNEIRQKYGIDKNDFVVFFNFDYGSSFFRKNPDGAVRVFAKALGDRPDAKLVFKTMRADKHHVQHRALKVLAVELGVADKFISIDSYIPQRDLLGLTAACDVYLSLHRGEGFGIGIAEAMSLGRPAIVTNYSSTTEFCNQTNSFPVPYRIVEVRPEQRDHPCYTYVQTCAEPDESSAIEILSSCYRNREKCAHVGAKAQTFIKHYFCIDRFGVSARKLLRG
jgi:glycosyltransferase involved in cell wall biosynthesis